MEQELLKFEQEFTRAIAQNDAEAIGGFVADDWVVIGPDGRIIEKERFLGVIKSGALTHETMESDEIRVRVFGDSAVVTALTRTKGKFMGKDFSTQERATDVFVKGDGRWQCVLSQLTQLPEK